MRDHRIGLARQLRHDGQAARTARRQAGPHAPPGLAARKEAGHSLPPAGRTTRDPVARPTVPVSLTRSPATQTCAR
jgi:hypothetical protein